MFTSFAAISRLNLADAILLAQLSPILMALGAVIFLSEKLTVCRVAGLACGFAGVIARVWPELQDITLRRFLPLYIDFKKWFGQIQSVNLK